MRQLAILFILTLAFTSLYASSKTTKTVRILENLDPGSQIADASQLLHLTTISDRFKLLDHKILGSSAGRSSFLSKEVIFGLNESGGQVNLLREIDREKLCNDLKVCAFELEIYAIAEQKLLNLQVYVDDVNDNQPVFPQQQIIVNISESALIGEVINLNQFLAQDSDIGENAALTYSISFNKYFKIEQVIENDDTVHLQLKVIDLLDHESYSFERIRLTAQDHGNPPLSSTAEIIVKILDVNDNSPVFENEEYTVELSENLYPGFLVIRVHARDFDSGNSGVIRYRLSTQNKPAVLRLLKINDITGDVTLKEMLDRELYDKLRVLIEACDGSSTNQRVGRTRLIITVKDVNDNSPNINVNFIFIAEENKVYLPENAEIGTNIAYITANDPDLGLNGEVEIFIESVTSSNEVTGLNPYSLRTTFNLTHLGFLYVNRRLDREILDRFDVTIGVCDLGSTRKCSYKTIKVILLDVNEHRPMLPSSVIFLNASEDTKVGTILTTIQATDDDAVNPPAYYQDDHGKISLSPYGKIFYHIINGDGTFSISPHSGQLFLARSLDREIRDRYEIIVRAKDSGHGIAQQSTCKVYIQVTDINDNRPKFIQPQYSNVTFYATIKRKHVIAKIKAIDLDIKNNGSVSYYITHVNGKNNAETNLFLMNETTGELQLNFTRKNLNLSLGSYRISVQAVDNGSIPLSTTQTFYVSVINSDTVPTSKIPNLQKASPPTIIFIIISCIASAITIGAIIVSISVRYKRRKKERTYTCSSEEDWTLAAPLKNSFRSDLNNFKASRSINLRNDNEFEMQSFRNRYSLSNGANNESRATNYDDDGREEDACLALLENLQPYPDKKVATLLRQHFLTSSSHDGDSGRGDSDLELVTIEATNDQENQNQNPRFQNRQKHQGQVWNRHCNDQCLLYGHSDLCWMPSGSTTTFSSPLSLHDASGSQTPHFVETKNKPRFLPQSQHHDCRSKKLMTNSVTHRPGWNYPANDLSAIYSDVVMKNQRSNNRYSSFRLSCANSELTYVDSRQDVRASVIASTSSTESKYHQAFYSTSQITPIHVEKRHSALIPIHSVSSQPQLVRSSSADLLNPPDCVPRPLKGSCSEILKRKNNIEEVSMKETKDILDNIDQLLKP